MNLKDIGRMAADEIAGEKPKSDYGRIENGDGTVTLSFDFNLDPKYAAEMAQAMPKGQTREDQVDASVAQDAAVDLVEHDRRYHKNGYKPGDRCVLREMLNKYYQVDVVAAEEEESRLNMIGLANEKANRDLDVLQTVRNEFDDPASFYKAINQVFPQGYAFVFGTPTGLIKPFLGDTPIRLLLKVLLNKSRDSYHNHHPFSFEDAKDLAINIHEPAFILKGGSENANVGEDRSIRVFFSSGKFTLFCVVISPDGNVNDIVTLFPKDAGRLASFFRSMSGIGKDILAVDKQKTETLLRRWYNTTSPEDGFGFSIESLLNKFGIVNGEGDAQDAAVEGDARHAETPIENCRAKDPMFCPYHGTRVMTQKLQTMLKEHGIDGKVEVTGKGYHFTAKVTVPAQDEQSAVADIYNGFLQQKGFVAVKKGTKGDDQAESDGVEASYEAEAKVDEQRRLEPRELMSEWVDNIIDRLATDPDAKKQISRNDYLDMLGAVAEMHKAADAAAQNAADPNLAAAAQAAYDKASDAVDAITAMIDYKDVKTVDDGKKLSDGFDQTVAKAKATYAPLDQQVRQKKVALFGARGSYPPGFTNDHPWAAEKLSAKLSDFSHTGKTLAEAETQMRAAYGTLQAAGKSGTDALSYAERKSLRVALQKMSAAAEQVEGHAAANEKKAKAVISKLDELIAANPNGLAKAAKPAKASKTSVASNPANTTAAQKQAPVYSADDAAAALRFHIEKANLQPSQMEDIAKKFNSRYSKDGYEMVVPKVGTPYKPDEMYSGDNFGQTTTDVVSPGLNKNGVVIKKAQVRTSGKEARQSVFNPAVYNEKRQDELKKTMSVIRDFLGENPSYAGNFGI